MEYFGDIQSKRNVIICAANYNKLTSHFSRLSKTRQKGWKRGWSKSGSLEERERKITICTTTKVTPESYLSNTLSRKSVQTGVAPDHSRGGGVDGAQSRSSSTVLCRALYRFGKNYFLIWAAVSSLRVWLKASRLSASFYTTLRLVFFFPSSFFSLSAGFSPFRICKWLFLRLACRHCTSCSSKLDPDTLEHYARQRSICVSSRDVLSIWGTTKAKRRFWLLVYERKSGFPAGNH